MKILHEILRKKSIQNSATAMEEGFESTNRYYSFHKRILSPSILLSPAIILSKKYCKQEGVASLNEHKNKYC